MRGNISMMPSLSIAWPRCFPQAVGQQHFGADGFKTVSASHALRQLHQSVQAFSVPGGVSVGEVVENGVPVVLNGQRQRQEGFVDIKRNVCKPCKVALQGSCFCSGLVDVVKRFFEMVDGFQASREQLENMKLVYNQFGMWQNLMYRIMVASPHIRTHDGDMLFYGIGQVLQVPDNRGFGALSKQINDSVVGDIGDHTAVLMQQIQLVNPQVEQFGVWNVWLKGCGEFAKENTDRAFYQADFISDAHKGSSQCLLLDVGDQAIGHKMAFVHAWERLEEGTAASTTAIAVSLNRDPDALPSYWQVHEELRFFLMKVQLCVTAVGTLKWRSCKRHLEVKIVCIFIYYKNAKVIQAQEIQGHLSRKVLPKKFSFVVVFPVARERRLQRAYSTHFRDVDLLCWSV